MKPRSVLFSKHFLHGEGTVVARNAWIENASCQEGLDCPNKACPFCHSADEWLGRLFASSTMLKNM